ncbi:hypothetical protein K435DRAFT_331442 [Dendrothele bispora CBS 962.96]|uniref:Uncharacterized protein n=1 Tax=Dendrothele bispora (strain CBS 962.96) TaxID=1314807 RepID=A0A4S8MW32_DENBC|nr:hypothetical protein K435DRAFT_331442 [Dendrothele bispora CBS 962.96]
MNRRRRRSQAVDPCLGFYPTSPQIKTTYDNPREITSPASEDHKAELPLAPTLQYQPITITTIPEQTTQETADVEVTSKESAKDPDMISVDKFLKSYRCRKRNKRKRRVQNDDDETSYSPGPKYNGRSAKRTRQQARKQKLPLAERLLRASIRCDGDPIDELVNAEVASSRPTLRFAPELASQSIKNNRRKWTLVDAHAAPSMTASFSSSRERHSVVPTTDLKPLSKWPSVCHSSRLALSDTRNHKEIREPRLPELPKNKRKPAVTGKTSVRVSKYPPLNFVPLHEERFSKALGSSIKPDKAKDMSASAPSLFLVPVPLPPKDTVKSSEDILDTIPRDSDRQSNSKASPDVFQCHSDIRSLKLRPVETSPIIQSSNVATHCHVDHYTIAYPSCSRTKNNLIPDPLISPEHYSPSPNGLPKSSNFAQLQFTDAPEEPTSDPVSYSHAQPPDRTNTSNDENAYFDLRVGTAFTPPVDETSNRMVAAHAFNTSVPLIDDRPFCPKPTNMTSSSIDSSKPLKPFSSFFADFLENSRAATQDRPGTSSRRTLRSRYDSVRTSSRLVPKQTSLHGDVDLNDSDLFTDHDLCDNTEMEMAMQDECLADQDAMTPVLEASQNTAPGHVFLENSSPSTNTLQRGMAELRAFYEVPL